MKKKEKTEIQETIVRDEADMELEKETEPYVPPAEEKPKRGRKPRAVKQQTVSGLKGDTMTVKEPESTGNEDRNHEETAQISDSPVRRLNQEFQERAGVIREQMHNIQNSFIMIGFQLYWIRTHNMYRVLNYKNVYEYAEKEYGIKKTNCCNFISIIENYAERNARGEVIESIAGCYKNYSASQLVAMLGMPADMQKQITPAMSVRTINRLRKGVTQGTIKEAAVSSGRKEPAPIKESDTEQPVIQRTEEGEVYEASAIMEGSSCVTGDDTFRDEQAIPAETAKPQEDSTITAAMEAPKEKLCNAADTLMEINSYRNYQNVADKIDAMIKNVFSSNKPVRVRIICEQG